MNKTQWKPICSYAYGIDYDDGWTVRMNKQWQHSNDKNVDKTTFKWEKKM